MSKSKPALPERLYYRLADAAQLLGCSADDLLHYGACGYLEILASGTGLWAHRWRSKRKDSSDADRTDDHGSDSSFDFFAVPAGNCREMEQRGSCSPMITWNLYKSENSRKFEWLKKINWRGDDDPNNPKYSLGFFSITKGCYAPSPDNPIGDDSPVIVMADLWVRTEELRRFQKEGSSHVRTDPELPLNFKKPHGNAENHARNREAVLRAAIAVKANSPDLCGKTNRDWAKAIDEKALLFWPDGEPPLKLETIERLLGECLKLPDGK